MKAMKPKCKTAKKARSQPEEETQHGVMEICSRKLRELPRKYYLDNVEVYIAGEQAFELDPEGNILRTVQFTDYVTENIRRLNLTAEHLRQAWPLTEQRLRSWSSCAAMALTLTTWRR